MSSPDIYNSILQKFNDVYDHNIKDYIDFCISNSLQEKIKYKTACHHILPRWAFPQYGNLKLNSWNSAILTHENHLRAHFMLWCAWKNSNNATPLLLMVNRKLHEISNTVIESYVEEYAAACESHAHAVSLIHTGKSISTETIDKIRISKIQNGTTEQKGMLRCFDKFLNISVSVSVDEYAAGKSSRYVHYAAGKPAWNQGKEVPATQNTLTAIHIPTGEHVRITSDEYSSGKGSTYMHHSTGREIQSLHNLVLVTHVSSGNKIRISAEEYYSNPSQYKFHSANTVWYNNGISSIRIPADMVPPLGFTKGRGTTVNKEYVKTRTPPVKKQCPVCHKMVDPGNFKKHHGEKCKFQ